jgi:hypothetical protein
MEVFDPASTQVSTGARVTVIYPRGGHHRKHVHCLAMDVYFCRVLFYALPDNKLFTKNLFSREGVYRAVA